jgi:hypothetical protein
VRAKKRLDAPPTLRTQSAPVTPTHSQLGGSKGERAMMPSTPRTARPNARDVFSSSEGPGRKRSDTNDSTESGSNADGQSEDDERRYEERVTKRTYPHNPDDPEESVSLWRRPSLDDSEENAPVSSTGIRLVRQAGSSGNRF